ncbi:MAG TPA: hypothetical protein VKT32_00385 [Chthonomonadaceae bacterium]|nr:hypothetical protein [Chthonomonadaceae bacterium]
MAILLLCLALWIAGGFGRRLLQPLQVLRAAPLERFAYAAALGLGVAAYGIFALGLAGQLSFWPVTAWWLALALAGSGGMRANARDLAAALLQARESRIPQRPTPFAYLPALVTLLLLICAAIAVIACFSPPTGREWDALAYHLADPKVFLAQHRITSLPTEHHSNFPLTMEMLFTAGLLYGGYPLANLFHFATALLTVLAILALCRRRLGPMAGYLAALIFATTPLVLWEASVAYIDLGMGLFTTLAAFAAVSAAEEGRGKREQETEQKGRGKRREEGREEDPTPDGMQWCILAGLMMGFALGIKYLALAPLAFVGLLLLMRRVPLRAVALYAGLALVIGAPWYIKNVLLTSNPVYPYYYSLFPHSRYWSADRAAIYQSEQNGFGYPHALKGGGDTIRNLIATPWHLLADPESYTNRGDFTFISLIGGLYAAFCLALLFLDGVPRVVRDLLALGALQVLAWFFTAQVVRYLVSFLPLLAVAAGYAAWRLLDPADPDKESVGGEVGWGWKLASQIAAGAALAGQTAFLLWGLFVLPTTSQAIVETGMMPTALSVPDAIAALFSPGERRKELESHLDIYPAMEWINTHAPPDARVLLYEEDRGFYLDRGYLWGNGEHSSYIPYRTMRAGKDLAGWMRNNRYEYVLINLNWSPQRPSQQSPAGQEAQALQEWYAGAPAAPGTPPWRLLLDELIRTGALRPVFAEHGVVVLELGNLSRMDT